ncbi:MAG: transaldolase [Gammaproteobacteria bacterium]|nr:transaldolase [Gammaproteobacteria bacterium]
MDNAPKQLHRLGQSLWLDNITRAMLRSGTLTEYRDNYAVSGLTSNPTIFDRAIESSDDYDAAIRAAGRVEPEAVFFDLAIADLRKAAEVFAPVHARSGGVDGYVSLEVSPLLADDTPATIEQACTLHQRADLPNLFIKVPGTVAGVPAIEELIYRGVPINVTLLFSPQQYRAAADAYLRGLERRQAEGLSLDVASVASLFVSRWDAKVADEVPKALRNRLGLAVSGCVYADYRKLLNSPRMQRLMNAGARPQRLLWASTGTKDPDASDVLYVDNLAAPLTVNTMPDKTLKAFADHGRCDTPLAADGGDAERQLVRFAELGFRVDPLAETLQQEGKESFASSWRDLLSTIRERMAQAA